jgi:hypothetical protein
MTFTKTLAAVCLALAGTSLNAATITQFGSDVSFTYDDSTAYGIGTVTGNSIFFNPTTIFAESLGGGSDTMHATINIDVTATTAGFSLSAFSIFESGDYQLAGSGASVDAQGFFQATSNTNANGCTGAGPGTLNLCQGTATYSAGTLPDTANNIALWSMGGTINLADTVNWGSDTSVNLTIQNNLAAITTAAGEHAFIQKKFTIDIPQVPVPAAVWLFGSGLIGLIGVARRKTI